MLVFLDGIYNSKWEPNENYAREMMELFSLGADRGAYTEKDVREMARALTGWTAEWTESAGLQNFRFQASRHDTGNKTVFGQTGKWSWEDAVRLCVSHPLHASFFVREALELLRADAAERSHARLAAGALPGLAATASAPVVEAILQHPDFLNGPELVTPPVVYNAGLLRAIGRPIDTTAWAWLSRRRRAAALLPAQRVGLGLHPLARHLDRQGALGNRQLCDLRRPTPTRGRAKANRKYSETEEPAEAMASAMAYWGSPLLSAESQSSLDDFAQSSPRAG